MGEYKMAEVGMKHYLMQQMEVKRAEMIRAAALYGFTSEETVLHSQELDRLMNMYVYLFGYQKKFTLQALKYAN